MIYEKPYFVFAFGIGVGLDLSDSEFWMPVGNNVGVRNQFPVILMESCHPSSQLSPF